MVTSAGSNETILDRFVTEFIFRGKLSDLDKIEGRIEGFKKQLDTLSLKATLAGAALSAPLAQGLSKFLKYETGVAHIATRTGEDLEKIQQQYRDFISDLEKETTISAVDIADGIQKAISALPDASEDAIKDLARSGAMFVAAGLGDDVGEAISTATTMISQFGITGAEAFDTISRAAQIGEGDVADYTNAIKNLSQVAGEEGLGLSDSEATAILSTMSTITRDVNTAEQQVQAFLSQLFRTQRDGSMQARALEDLTGGRITGKDIEDRIAGGDFAGVMRDIQASMLAGVDPLTLDQFFETGDESILPDDARVSVGKAMELLGDRPALLFGLSFDVDSYLEKVAELEAANGTVEREFEKISTTAAFRFKRATISIGKIFEDFIQRNGKTLEVIAGAFQKFGDFMQNLDGPAGKLRDAILLLGPALIVLGIGLKGVSILLGFLMPLITAWGWMITLITGRTVTQTIVQDGQTISLQRNTAAVWLNTQARRAGALAVTVFTAAVRLATAAVSWNTAMTVRQNLALKALAIWQGAVAVATKIWTVAQWLLNAAMTANPIGLIIVGIGVLIGLGVLLWKNFDRVREAWNKWGNRILWLFPILKAFVESVKFFIRHWDSIVNAFKSIIGIFGKPFELAFSIDWGFFGDWYDKLHEMLVGWGRTLEDMAQMWNDLIASAPIPQWMKDMLSLGGIQCARLSERERAQSDVMTEKFAEIAASNTAAGQNAREFLQEQGIATNVLSSDELKTAFIEEVQKQFGQYPTEAELRSIVGDSALANREIDDIVVATTSEIAHLPDVEEEAARREQSEKVRSAAFRLLKAQLINWGDLPGAFAEAGNVMRPMLSDALSVDGVDAGGDTWMWQNRPEGPVDLSSGWGAPPSPEVIIPQLPVGPVAPAYPAGGAAVAPGGGDRSVSVSIGEIRVETQATDSQEIAAGIASDLEEQIRIATESFEDRVEY